MLIEWQGDVGGISTVGMMSHWTGRCGSRLYDEILTRCAKTEGVKRSVTINPEILKTVYLEMLEDAGCRLRLYTFVSDVIKEGDRVIGVVTESKSGREIILADTVIDARMDRTCFSCSI